MSQIDQLNMIFKEAGLLYRVGPLDVVRWDWIVEALAAVVEKRVLEKLKEKINEPIA